MLIVVERARLPRTIVDVDWIALGDADEVLETQLDLLEVLEALEDAVEDGHNRLCVFRPRLRGAGAHATGRGEKSREFILSN